METGTTVTRDVPLAGLRAFHESLVAAAGEAGFGGARLGDLLDRGVLAECAQCGFRVSGGDVAAAFAAEDARTSANPKHARLLQHYCARAGCSSYFYRFTFVPAEGVDWGRILARAGEFAAGVEAGDRAAREQKSAVARAVRMRRIRLILAGVAALALVGSAWRWWRTGALPGQDVKPRFQVDTNSLPKDLNRRVP